MENYLTRIKIITDKILSRVLGMKDNAAKLDEYNHEEIFKKPVIHYKSCSPFILCGGTMTNQN